jgi:hypothetical protein
MWAAAELGITLQQVDAGGAFELNAKNPKYTGMTSPTPCVKSGINRCSTLFVYSGCAI